jgi:hypothetical protein
MSLSADPTFTAGSTGNILSSQSLSGGASVTTSAFYVGVSGQTGSAGSTTTGSALVGNLQVLNTGTATVSGTNGLLVQALRSVDGGATYDSIPLGGVNFVIPTPVSAVAVQGFDLPPGQYKLKLTNQDATYAITVAASMGTTQ